MRKKQFSHTNSISKWCHITLILLILVIQATTISFIVATFVTYEKVLIKIKLCYTSKDLSYFLNFNKLLRTGQKSVTKIVKNAPKVKLQT